MLSWFNKHGRNLFVIFDLVFMIQRKKIMIRIKAFVSGYFCFGHALFRGWIYMLIVMCYYYLVSFFFLFHLSLSCLVNIRCFIIHPMFVVNFLLMCLLLSVINNLCKDAVLRYYFVVIISYEGLSFLALFLNLNDDVYFISFSFVVISYEGMCSGYNFCPETL